MPLVIVLLVLYTPIYCAWVSTSRFTSVLTLLAATMAHEGNSPNSDLP